MYLYEKTVILTPAQRTAFYCIFLIAPGAIILYVLQHNVEVNVGPLQPYLEMPESGTNLSMSLAALIFTVILPVIALIRNIKVLKNREPGSSLASHHLNVLLIIGVILLLLLLTGGIITDQYPCWMSVPNCD